MAKTPTSIRLTDDQRNRWKEKAKELGLEDRTDLIATAVENFIAKGGFEGDGDLAQGEAINQLQSSVNDLETKVDEISQDLRAIKRQTAAADEGKKELAHDVLDRLPNADDIDMEDARRFLERQAAGTLTASELERSQRPPVPVTAKTVHSWLESDDSIEYDFPLSLGDVEDALEFLDDQYHAKDVEIEGETRWMKEV